MELPKQDEPIGPIRNAAKRLSTGFQDTRTPPAPNDYTPIVDMEAANNQAAQALQQEAYQQRMQAPYVPMGQLRSGAMNTGAVIPSLAEKAAIPGVGYQAPAPIDQPKASPAPRLARAADFNAEDDPQFREQQRRERDAATRIAGAKKGIPTTTAAGTLPSVDFNGRPLPPSDPQSRESRARQQAQAAMDQVYKDSAAKTAANPPRAGAQAQAEMDKMMAADAAKTPGDPSRLGLRGVPTDPSRRGQLGAPNVGTGGRAITIDPNSEQGRAGRAERLRRSQTGKLLTNGKTNPLPTGTTESGLLEIDSKGRLKVDKDGNYIKVQNPSATSPAGTPTTPAGTSAGVTYAPDINGGVSPVDYGGRPQANVVGTAAGPRLQGNNGAVMPFVNDPVTGTSLPLATEFSAEEYARAITPEQREQLIDSIATAKNDTGKSMRAFLNAQGKGQSADTFSPAEKDQNNSRLDARIDNLIYGVMRNPGMFMRDRNTQKTEQDRGSRQDQAKMAMEERKKVAEAAKAATAQQRTMQKIYQESEAQARRELTANKFQAPSEQQIQARAAQLARSKGYAPPGAPSESGAPDLSGQPQQPQQPAQPPRYSMSGNSSMEFKVDRNGMVDAYDAETGQTFPAARVGTRLVVVATGPEVIDAISEGTEYILPGDPTKIEIKKATGDKIVSPETKFASTEENDFKIKELATAAAEKRRPAFEAYQKDQKRYREIKDEADLRAKEAAGGNSFGDKFIKAQQAALLEVAEETYGNQDDATKIPDWIRRSGKRITGVDVPAVPDELKTSKQEFDTAETKKSNEARSAAVKEAQGIERGISTLATNLIKKGGAAKTANEVNSRADAAVKSFDTLSQSLAKASEVGGTLYGNTMAKSGQGKAARTLLQYAVDPTAVAGGLIYPPSEDTNPIQFEKDISSVIESAGASGSAIMKKAFAPLYDANRGRLVVGNNNPIDASNKEFVAARNFVFANTGNKQLVRDWSRLTSLYSETPNYDPANPEGNQDVAALLQQVQRSGTAAVVGKVSPGVFDASKPGDSDMSAAERRYYEAGQSSKEKVSQSQLAAKAKAAYSTQVFKNSQTGQTEVMVKGSPVPAVQMRVAGQVLRIPKPENAQQVMQMIDAGLPFNAGGKVTSVDQNTPQYKPIVEQKDKVVLTGRAGENPGVKATNEFVKANFGYLNPSEQKSLYEMILKKNGYQQQ
jgi:hypothetical protein